MKAGATSRLALLSSGRALPESLTGDLREVLGDAWASASLPAALRLGAPAAEESGRLVSPSASRSEGEKRALRGL